MQNILEKSILFLSISFIILKSLPTFQYLQNKPEAIVKLQSSKSQINQAYFFLPLNQIHKQSKRKLGKQ